MNTYKPKISMEVVISVMNITTQEQFEKFIQDRKIQGRACVINQVTDDEKPLINCELDNIKIVSSREKGTSKSRNRGLEYANTDVIITADDDIQYLENYEEIVDKAYQKHPNADVIIFRVDSQNKQRKIKKIKNGKMNKLQAMKVRASQITYKKSVVCEKNIKYDERFGPATKFNKGEDTIFVADCINKGLNVISCNKKIGEVENKESTWFTGFNEQFFYVQGAIFARTYTKYYKLIILQYVLRKTKLYKEKYTKKQIYNIMKQGANAYRMSQKCMKL